MDLVYSGELLLNLQELFSDQPSLLCQKKLILGGMFKLWLEAVMRQIASGIDILEHLGRLRDKTRKVLEIMEV